jgi:hypothetical protein
VVLVHGGVLDNPFWENTTFFAASTFSNQLWTLTSDAFNWRNIGFASPVTGPEAKKKKRKKKNEKKQERKRERKWMIEGTNVSSEASCCRYYLFSFFFFLFFFFFLYFSLFFRLPAGHALGRGDECCR